MTYLIHRDKAEDKAENQAKWKQSNMFQMKYQDKTSGKKNNKTKQGGGKPPVLQRVPGNDQKYSQQREYFKRRDEHSEKFNKKLENIKKIQTELKNTIT